MFSPRLTYSNILEKTEVQVNIGFHDGVCNLRNVMASEAVFSSLFATLGVSWATLGLKMRRPGTPKTIRALKHLCCRVLLLIGLVILIYRAQHNYAYRSGLWWYVPHCIIRIKASVCAVFSSYALTTIIPF